MTMSVTTIRIGTAGRGQIPHNIRQKLNIPEGDTLVVEIKEILKGNELEEHRRKQEVSA
jgi:AbrB family looped-hinge helix DNA binding protein